MQLSASLLPFDLPPVPGAAPLPVGAALTPAADVADFGALLTAQSAPASPVVTPPVAPFSSTAPADGVSEPAVEPMPPEWLMEEGSADSSDAVPNPAFAEGMIATAPSPTTIGKSDVAGFVAANEPLEDAPASTTTSDGENDTAPSEIGASALVPPAANATKPREVGRSPAVPGTFSNSTALNSEGSAASPLHSPTADAAFAGPSARGSRANSKDTTALSNPTAADAPLTPAEVPVQRMPQRDVAELNGRAVASADTSFDSTATESRPTTAVTSGAEISNPATVPITPLLRSPLAAAATERQNIATPPGPSPISSPSPKTNPTPQAPVDETAGALRSENVDTAAISRAQSDASVFSATPPQSGPEKFAVSARRGASSPLAAYKTTEKNTENAFGEEVETEQTFVGTNAAKPEFHMPHPAPHAPSAPHAVERLSQAVAPLSFEFNPGEAGGETAELAQAARRAVNAAVSASEQFAAEAKPAVTLKFTVSGVDLGVRVELRGENIHTTFRTDSPELRAALAQEWQAVTAVHAGDRSARLAEPVFTSNPSQASTSTASNNSSNSDSGAADQRGSQHRQEQNAADEWARFRAASRPADAANVRVPTPSFPIRSHPTSAPGRLHTFA